MDVHEALEKLRTYVQVNGLENHSILWLPDVPLSASRDEAGSDHLTVGQEDI